MSLPTVVCQGAFGVNPYTTPTSIQWSTLGNVESFSIDTGREREEGRTKTGLAKVSVRNDTRLFDPLNTLSPYYPNLVPGVRLRIKATWDGVDYYLFTGFVEDWPQIYESSFSARVQLDASDGFARFAAESLDESIYSTEVLADNPSVYLRLGETGRVAADTSTNANDGQYQGSPAQGVPGLVVGSTDRAFSPANTSDQRVSLPYPALIRAFPFTVEAWLSTPMRRDVRKTIFAGEQGPRGGGTYMSLAIESDPFDLSRAGQVVAIVSNNGVATRYYSGQWVDNNITHHVVWVATTATTWAIWVDGVNLSVRTLNQGLTTYPGYMGMGYAAGNTPAVAFGDFGLEGTLDELAVYPTALTSTQIADHYSAGSVAWDAQYSGARIGAVLDLIGWSASDRQLDAGSSSLYTGSTAGTVLDYLQKVAESEDGLMYMTGDGKLRLRARHSLLNDTTSLGTFGDTDAELPYDDLLPSAPAQYIRNDIRIKSVNGGEATATDTTSRTRYGPRTYERGPLLTGTSSSADLANWLLARYKDPHTRFKSMVLSPEGAEATLFPQLLARQMGDRITVIRRPVGGGPNINIACRIEGVKHECNGRTWKTTWALSPVNATTYWVLGTGALDSTTRLAY